MCLMSLSRDSIPSTVATRTTSGSDRGYVDTAEILTIADATARQNALVTGAVDVIGDVDATSADLLLRKGDIKFLISPALNTIPFQCVQTWHRLTIMMCEWR